MNINFLPKISPRNDDQKAADFERTMLQKAAKIGGAVFGPLPKGHDRQFFCLDENTWIWHEEWKQDGKLHSITTRYDVRSNGVTKSQDGQATQRLSDEEARNLYKAVQLYQQRVDAEYRRMLQAS